MKVLGERTFTCNGEDEYPGYEVEYGSRIVPAFTHEQMKECQRVQAELVETHSNEEFALLECHGREWREVYYDGVWAYYTPVNVDGMHAIGGSLRQARKGNTMEYGKALNEYADYIWEAFEADNADETEWSAYQFEYPEDEFPVFSAYVEKAGGEWVASMEYADWAPVAEKQFTTKYAAMEWLASWAWCPEVGQGERTVPKWACPNEECSGSYGEHPAILDGDEEHGWTCPKCGCSTNFPEADGCYYLGRE